MRRTAATSVVSEHDAVMDAIRTDDVEGAQAALAEHLSRAHERVLAQITAD